MSNLVITRFYTGIFGLTLVALSINVLRHRIRTKTPVSHGTDTKLQHAIQATNDFIEYVPLTLILLGFAEWHYASYWLLHIFGALLLLGRICHSHDLLDIKFLKGKKRYNFLGKSSGLLMTFFVISGLSGYVIGSSLNTSGLF